MATPPTVVNLDLYKLCEERVGTGSFLTDLPIWNTKPINAQFYSTFGIGTIVEILYDSGWEKGIIMNDSGNRTYSIYFISDAKTVAWTLAENNRATEPGADFKIKPTEWRLAVSLSDIEEAGSDARETVDDAELEYLAAKQVDEAANQVFEAANKAPLIQSSGRSSRSQTSPNLTGAKKNLEASTEVLKDAKKILKDAEEGLRKLVDEYKDHEALIKYGEVNSLSGGEMQTDTDELKEIFKKFDKSYIFYGLFRILMACDPIHDFLGTRGFNNCKVFGAGVTTVGDIKIKFRSGIIDAVIDSFVGLFKLVPVTRASIQGPSNKKQKLTAEYTPEFLARALLHACLIIIGVPLKKDISLKQNLIDILKSDDDAKKLAGTIITTIGLKRVSGNIQRNEYKTGFPTIVDTHEAIDSLYKDEIYKDKMYWKGDIECRIDAIKDHNHFIPIIIGLWNSSNINISNDLSESDKLILESAIDSSVSPLPGVVRDVYSTFRKINIKRDISTNFDASFVDSLTKTVKCISPGSCQDEYAKISFDITCNVGGKSVQILSCSLKAETEDEYARRKAQSDLLFAAAKKAYSDAKKAYSDVKKAAKTAAGGITPSVIAANSTLGVNASNAQFAKKIPLKRKITLNVFDYFGATSPGNLPYYNVNDNGELMGVNKISLNICQEQQNIVEKAWVKTLGDFLQITTYLSINQAKMFVTLDKISSNIACLFDRFVFLEDVSGKGLTEKSSVVVSTNIASGSNDPLPVPLPDPLPDPEDSTENLSELYDRVQKGTYIYIPKVMDVPPKMTNVKILSESTKQDIYNVFEQKTTFGKNNKSRFGKKISAAIIQARAYLSSRVGKKKINTLPVNELRTKLNSVGIKTYVLKSGKKVNLSLRQLQSAANYFKKLQISCKNAGIKLMYNRNGKYYYKSYIRLMNESRKSGKSGKSGKSNKINAMDVNELRTRLNSVGIKTYVLNSGKKVNLPLIQLQRAANYFKKLQIRCKNAGIKLMYKRNGKYYYKSYSRLVKESRHFNKFG